MKTGKGVQIGIMNDMFDNPSEVSLDDEHNFEDPDDELAIAIETEAQTNGTNV